MNNMLSYILLRLTNSHAGSCNSLTDAARVIELAPRSLSTNVTCDSHCVLRVLTFSRYHYTSFNKFSLIIVFMIIIISSKITKKKQQKTNTVTYANGSDEETRVASNTIQRWQWSALWEIDWYA
jgi:hypothetical protein